jgi:hypothetical protein
MLRYKRTKRPLPQQIITPPSFLAKWKLVSSDKKSKAIPVTGREGP